jgi:3-oxoacyl-[acyl-carrier protein] reductase
VIYEHQLTLPRLAGAGVGVTGGASGIGRATVLLAARSGADVVAGDINRELLTELGTIARSERLSIRCVPLDVRDQGSVAEFVAAANAGGRLRGVVNCAGIAEDRPALDISRDFWENVLRVNLTGTFLVARAAAAVLARSGAGGAIVNVASAAGTTGRENSAPYSATKGAVISLTRALAREWGPLGIRVNCVSPGAVDTPLRNAQAVMRDTIGELPLPRVGTPEEVALVIGCFLTELTPWVTGQTLNVNGGSVMY